MMIIYSSSYELSGKVYQTPMKQVFGKGSLNFTAGGLQVMGTGQLSMQGQDHLRLDNLYMSVMLSKLEANLSGLMRDPLFSETASKAISAVVPELLVEHHAVISSFMAPRIQGAVNQALDKITIGDIISYYQPPTTNDKPTKIDRLVDTFQKTKVVV